MIRAQMSLEIVIIYGLAIVSIGLAVAIIITFLPAFSQTPATATYSGFQGFKITAVGYYAPYNVFYIKIQNLLNENLEVKLISLLVGSQNSTGCGGAYLQPLDYYECNITYSNPGSFSGLVYIYYTPTNISSAPVIASRGSVYT